MLTEAMILAASDLPTKLMQIADGSLDDPADEAVVRDAADALVRLRADNERLRAAAKPFADHDWYDAELEDDSCKLTRHSGPVTVGHWKALRAALTASGRQ